MRWDDDGGNQRRGDIGHRPNAEGGVILTPVISARPKKPKSSYKGTQCGADRGQ